MHYITQMRRENDSYGQHFSIIKTVT